MIENLVSVYDCSTLVDPSTVEQHVMQMHQDVAQKIVDLVESRLSQNNKNICLLYDLASLFSPIHVPLTDAIRLSTLINTVIDFSSEATALEVLERIESSSFQAALTLSVKVKSEKQQLKLVELIRSKFNEITSFSLERGSLEKWAKLIHSPTTLLLKSVVLSDKILKKVIEASQQLQHLTVDSCIGLKQAAFVGISFPQHLKSISLINCSIQTADFNRLNQECQLLESITLEENQYVKFNKVCWSASLQNLTLRSTSITAADAKAIALHNRSLKVFFLEEGNFSEADLKEIREKIQRRNEEKDEATTVKELILQFLQFLNIERCS